MTLSCGDTCLSQWVANLGFAVHAARNMRTSESVQKRSVNLDWYCSFCQYVLVDVSSSLPKCTWLIRAAYEVTVAPLLPEYRSLTPNLRSRILTSRTIKSQCFHSSPVASWFYQLPTFWYALQFSELYRNLASELLIAFNSFNFRHLWSRAFFPHLSEVVSRDFGLCDDVVVARDHRTL